MKKRLAWSLCLVLGILSAGCHTGKTSQIPMKTAPTPIITSSIHPVIQWSLKATDGISNRHLHLPLLIEKDTIFVADTHGKLVAIDRNHGTIRWKNKTSHSFTTGMGKSQENLFIATSEGELAAFHATQGKAQWVIPLHMEVLTTPLAQDGLVFVKSIDDVLMALSEKDGHEVWRHHESNASLILRGTSQPILANHLIIAGFSNGKIKAFEAHSGELLWTATLAEPNGKNVVEQMVDIDVNPVVDHDVLYTATYQGYLSAINLQTGKLLWKEKASSNTGLTVDSDHVYLGEITHTLSAFAKDSGVITWHQKNLGKAMITAPALCSEYLIVGDHQGYLHWIDRETGEIITKQRLDSSGIFTPPLVIDNTAYVYTKRGSLYAVTLSNASR